MKPQMVAKAKVRNLLTRAVAGRVRYSRRDTNVIGEDVRGLAGVDLEGNNLVHSGVTFSGTITIGRATTIGTQCAIDGPATIGRYCQLAHGAAIVAVNHPMAKMTTYLNGRLLSGAMAAHVETDPITVGNDVWIGRNATILKGVTLGNGAVIGAGAVVTKDVAPYSIVVGVPAHPIGQRFSETVVDLLEELRWWDRPDEEIERHRSVFDLDLDGSEESLTALRNWIDSST